jgi:hypothetical protein
MAAIARLAPPPHSATGHGSFTLPSIQSWLYIEFGITEPDLPPLSACDSFRTETDLSGTLPQAALEAHRLPGRARRDDRFY